MTENFFRITKDFLDTSTMEKAGVVKVHTDLESPVKIISLEYDSRKVKKGSLYFALPGNNFDGHDYIPDAINKGALAVVHQKEIDEFKKGVLYIRVKDSRYAMSPISASFHDHPSHRLKVIGVTGTEGKSTTVYLIYQLLKRLGKKAGFISTVQWDDGRGEQWNQEHQTTPEATVIHRLLTDMCGNGLEYAVVESSSHGLSKKTNRLGDVEFHAGVMTNVNHDHLEFHGSWEQYRSDKAELFRSLKSFGVVNSDDPSADYFTAAANHKCYSFSTSGNEADMSVKLIQSTTAGNWYDADVSAGSSVSIRDKLPGAFNAGNVLAAVLTVSKLLSISIEEIISHVPFLKPVRGRMNIIMQGQPFEVLVDYAHTPSSFEIIFPPLRERLNSSGRKIISVFGSAGERDTEKRPLQGRIAARYSDIIILCDEDPRGENPMSILEDIAVGCETPSGCEADQGFEAAMTRDENLFLITDRPTAVRKAVSLARGGDLVLLLGKGHENSIIYSKETVKYDEIREAEQALKEAGYCLQP